ncbi:MAG: hypothetical protein JWO73_110 [Candidatus Taylorbacteria bacterium]|nr:hypothetical protein [Candidatus Taylorbacteria bacterium]
MHLFAPFIHHLESIVAHGGYAVIFITSILEGLPLIGSVVPGHTIIILAGFMAKIGVLSLPAVLMLGGFGAILGDGIAFCLGRKYGFGFLERVSRYLSIRESHIEKAKQLVAKHTGKAIIFGRFNPLTRTLMPFIVGASGGHAGKFWLYDIIAGVSWAVSSVLIGYVFGAGYHAAAGVMGKFVLAGFIIALIMIWAYSFINKRWHVFVKYDLFTLGLMLVSLYVSFKMIQDTVSAHSFMEQLDLAVNVWMSAHAAPAGSLMTGIMSFITNALSPVTFALLGIIATGIYFLKRNYKDFAFLILSLGGTMGWIGFIKELVMRVRPEGGATLYSDFSFPSLHAGMAAFGCVALIYVCFIHIKNHHAREAAIAAAVIISFLVPLSRLYLNVHWLSDVVAGYAIGVLWTTLMVLFVKYMAAILRLEKRLEEKGD